MKKIINKTYALLLIIIISGCAGYEPIFGSKNVNFKIIKHSINGDKILGNRIYAKIFAISSPNKNSDNIKKIDLNINVNKNQSATSKDSAGKILEYQITVDAEIVMKDLSTNKTILNKTFNSSTKYKIQDQYSKTIDLENQAIENIINNIYQNLLIVLLTEV